MWLAKSLLAILYFICIAISSVVNSQDRPKPINAKIYIQDRMIANSDKSMRLNEKAIRKRDTNGHTKMHIKVATVELAPFMMKKYYKTSDQNGTRYAWYGYCVDFFDELIRNLPYKITYEMYQVPENKFGSKIKRVVAEFDKLTNKTSYKTVEKWSGIIGDLETGKADLALAPLAVMAERELAIDFTVPFYDLVGIQILLRKPEVTRDIFKFLTVLDNEVWLSIGVAFFVTSFVIFIFDRLSPYSHKNSSRIKRLRRDHAENAKLLDKSNVNISKHNPIVNMHYIEPVSTLNQREMPAKFVGNNLHRTMVGHDRDENHSRRKSRNASWTESIRDVGRRSSLFLSQGIHGLFNKRDGAVHPTVGEYGEPIPLDGDLHSRRNTRESRASRVLSDYLKQIDFGRKNSSSLSTESSGIDDMDDGKPDFGFRDSLWFCITSLTPQGGGEAPLNLSGRIVAGAWWLFCFIIIASYTANLAAFLTVSRLDIPIESLEDLVKQYRIKFAPVEGTAEHAYFERMAYIEEIFYNIWRDMSLNESLTDEERSKFAVWDYPISDKYTKMWTQIQQVGMPHDHETGIKRVISSTLEEGFALLADANTIKHAVITDCRVRAVGEEFSRKPIALGLRKGQELLRDDISHAILRLINQRFMETLREKWWTNNPSRVNCDDSSESEGIGIENIGGVFIIIGAGVLLSFLAWLIERIAYQTRINISRDLMAS